MSAGSSVAAVQLSVRPLVSGAPPPPLLYCTTPLRATGTGVLRLSPILWLQQEGRDHVHPPQARAHGDKERRHMCGPTQIVLDQSLSGLQQTGPQMTLLGWQALLDYCFGTSCSAPNQPQSTLLSTSARRQTLLFPVKSKQSLDFGALFVAVLLLDLCDMEAEISPTNTESVFVSQQSANAVLSRPRRYNSGHLEEVLQANLERECREEQCTMEEAREYFENDEKTLEFWAGYIDGDQCDPPPCQNGGNCQDGVSSYICWCKPSFSGKNCEIVVAQQCLVDNGGCSHFCEMKEQQVVCLCASGYELAPDHRSCTPTEPFSCGQVTTDSDIKSKSILTPRTSNSAQRNSSLHDDGFDFNLTMFYEYYDDTGLIDSKPSPVIEGSTVDFPSDYQGDQVIVFDEVEEGNITDNGTLWFGPTLRNGTGGSTDKRIVGGDEATPGQIPWQVALMEHRKEGQRALPFCGASLISDIWVLTAAHCLIQRDGIRDDFFVRVGEHDVLKDEGQERDHNISEKIIHPNYSYKTSPYDHDIALIKLGEPVQLSDRRRPICLGPKHFSETVLRDATSSLVSGWGRLRFQGPESTKLQKLEVPYVDRTACKQSSRERITRHMFCAGYANEQKDSCQGDSGGPHATNYKGTWFLTGIVSWGEECARDGKYGVYTRISQYYRWISFKTGMKLQRTEQAKL